MAKGLPNLAIGYGIRNGASSKPGLSINPTGSAGSALVRDIRNNKGWGK